MYAAKARRPVRVSRSRKRCCSAPGEHFNPTGKPHGHYRVAERHVGDLINLQSDAEGNTVYAFETNLLTVTAGPTSVVGRTIVIDATPMITAHNRQETQAARSRAE